MPSTAGPPRVAFVTNFCPHYRVATFELLASKVDVHFYFYSEGRERYWLADLGIRKGQFPHQYLPGIRLAGVRVSASLPLELMTSGAEVFVSSFSGFFALPITYLVARSMGRPFVLWTGVWKRLQSARHKLTWPFLLHIYRHCHAIVTYGPHVREYLLEEGVQEGKIFDAPHATDNSMYRRSVSISTISRLREKLKIESDRKVILFVGRLVREKGITQLIQAVKLVEGTNAVLVIVGDGPLTDDLKEMTRELGIGTSVRFAGYVPPDETVKYYAMATVLAVPSITTATFKEPWGLVVNEAFNQGVPVIATGAVGAAAGGMVRHLENGLIIPEKDSTALAQAIRRLVRDDELRRRLSARAGKSIRGYTNEEMVKVFLRAFKYAQGDGT